MQEPQAFAEEFSKDYSGGSFDKIFNGYYDSHNPSVVKLDAVGDSSAASLEAFYTHEVLDALYRHNSLQYDINVLKDIVSGQFKIKSFDYDGTKYKSSEAATLLPTLEKELQGLKQQLEENDKLIAAYFSRKAANAGRQQEFAGSYNSFLQIEDDYEKKLEVATEMYNKTNFMYETTPFEVIHTKLAELKPTETNFRSVINEMLVNPQFARHMTDEMKTDLTKYSETEQVYFLVDSYNDAALKALFTALGHYQHLLSLTYFKTKKELLDLMAGMEREGDKLVEPDAKAVVS